MQCYAIQSAERNVFAIDIHVGAKLLVFEYNKIRAISTRSKKYRMEASADKFVCVTVVARCFPQEGHFSILAPKWSVTRHFSCPMRLNDIHIFDMRQSH